MNRICLKQQLELAIEQKKLARIDFVTIKGKITKDRLIEPYELKTRKDGELAVVAQCYLRNDLREFMLEGIQGIELTNKDNYGKHIKLTNKHGKKK